MSAWKGQWTFTEMMVSRDEWDWFEESRIIFLFLMELGEGIRI